MDAFPHEGVRLGTVRIQEAGQRIDEAAEQVVAFLSAAPGRIVDTAGSSDEVREIVIVGYALDDTASPRPGEGR
jgi:hypothetical protein